MAPPHNWAAGEASLPPRPASPSSSSAWVIDTAPTPSRGGEKAKRQRRHHSSSPELEQEPSFTFDVQGDEQADEASSEQGEAPSKPSSSSLLLPEHVAVAPQSAGDAPTDSPLDDPQGDDPGSLGDFTQLDGDATASRYYDVEAASARKALKECEICGERGHTKRDCDHLLCASCGATDEHTTRECPVGVACFRCGQKGHRRNECTADLRRMPRRTRECGRCGSYNHQMEACPTLWRIYAYVGEDEWEAFRRRKRARSSSSSDGEDDESWDPAQRWCYNCAARGTHWGDDCPMPRRSRHGEPSIFSELVSTMGPFGSRLAPPPPTAPRADGYARNDMYDVSVGPNTSMHFLGGAGRAGGSSSNASLEEEVDRMFARAPGASKRRAEKERGRRAAMAQESAAGPSSSTPATRTSKATKKDKQKGSNSKANGKAGNSNGPQQGMAATGTGSLPLPRAATGLEARMDDYIVISSDDDDDDANTSRASAKKRKRGDAAAAAVAPPKDKNSKKKKARLSNESANANANTNGKGKSKADKKAKKGGEQPPSAPPAALPPRGALGGKFAKERRLRALDAQQQANGGGGGGSSSKGSQDEPPASAPAKKKNKKQREKEKKAKEQAKTPPPPPPAAPSKKKAAPNGHTAANGAAGAGRGRPARGRGKGPMFRGGYD